MNKNQAKEEIKKIIAKYEQVKNSAKIKVLKYLQNNKLLNFGN